MEYTNLELGIDYLPYWDDETDSDIETETETSTELSNIELPF